MSFVSSGTTSFHDIDGRVTVSRSSDSNAARASASVFHVFTCAAGFAAGTSGASSGEATGAARTGEVRVTGAWMVAMKGELPTGCCVKEAVASGTRCEGVRAMRRCAWRSESLALYCLSSSGSSHTLTCVTELFQYSRPSAVLNSFHGQGYGSPHIDAPTFSARSASLFSSSGFSYVVARVRWL